MWSFSAGRSLRERLQQSARGPYSRSTGLNLIASLLSSQSLGFEEAIVIQLPSTISLIVSLACWASAARASGLIAS